MLKFSLFWLLSDYDSGKRNLDILINLALYQGE